MDLSKRRKPKNFSKELAKELVEEARESWKRIFSEKPHLEPPDWLEKGLLNWEREKK